MANDSKYGRLYPERAVALIKAAVESMLMNEHVPLADLQKALLSLEYDGFPPNEPLFLLRGQDELAPDTVRFYAGLVDARDAFTDLDIDYFTAFADRMRAWQPRKLPD